VSASRRSPRLQAPRERASLRAYRLVEQLAVGLLAEAGRADPAPLSPLAQGMEAVRHRLERARLSLAVLRRRPPGGRDGAQQALGASLRACLEACRSLRRRLGQASHT
jgi:hypothetical protein